MADSTIQVSRDRFASLQSFPEAWLIYLPVSLALQKGDRVTVEEVDTLGSPTGSYCFGIINLISTQNFFYTSDPVQCYYLSQVSRYPIIDFSALTVVTGWSALTVSSVFYQQVEGGVFVWYRFSGTSNSASVTFTLPFPLLSTAPQIRSASQVVNSGTTSSSPGMLLLQPSLDLAHVYRDWNLLAWTAAGSKTVSGEFFFPTQYP